MTDQITLIILEESQQCRLNRCGLFSGALSTGEIIVRRSRTPFLDAARSLLNRGYEPTTILQMVNNGVPSLRGPIGNAAKLRVCEDAKAARYARWESREQIAHRIARNDDAIATHAAKSPQAT